MTYLNFLQLVISVKYQKREINRWWKLLTHEKHMWNISEVQQPKDALRWCNNQNTLHCKMQRCLLQSLRENSYKDIILFHEFSPRGV